MAQIDASVEQIKKIEAALKECEDRLKLLSHASHEAIVFLDEEGRIVDVNAAALRVTGTSDREVTGQEINEFLKPSHYRDQQSLELALAEVLPAGALPGNEAASGRILELFITGPGGKESCIELSLLSEKIGEKWRMIAFFRDVTEKKNALESLRRSEERFRKLFENTKDAIFMTTPDGKVVDINRAGLELFGYKTKEEMMKLDVARDLYLDPDDRKNFRAAIERYGSASMQDLALKRADGSIVRVSSTVNAVYDEDGESVIFHGIVRDLTTVRQLEQQVRAFQKIDAVRDLIGTMAHHFNNILNIIAGSAQLAKLSPDLTEEMGTYLLTIEEEVFRAADMVDELLAVGSRHPMDMRITDVGAIVADFQKTIRNVIGEHIVPLFALPDKKIPVRLDIARIGQVLLNLIVNARDAMKGSGTLTIRVYTERLTDVTTTLDGKITPGEYAVVSVADTGPGIESSLHTKIFEPFFTTDTSGDKKGLGLSVVLGIVKQHGGFVIWESEKGRGTVFKVHLPVSIDQAKEEDLLDEPLAEGAETILIGEDEEALRKIAAEYLTTLRYRVHTAHDGEESLAIFREHSDEISIALLDIAMPGMSGLDVYHEIQKIKPIPVLFMTGYNLDILNLSSATHEGINAIRKPFTMISLARKLRSILDQQI
ncbi:MAG: PAS domain-containing hybrid sensor histidine kinase/response regulator [Syntrophorhabdaceae bacterium]